MYRVDRKVKTGEKYAKGGGVILYIKETLVSAPISTLTEQSMWCEVELPGDKLIVGVCYRSTSSADGNNQELLNLLASAVEYTGTSKLLLMGDFNYPDIDYEKYTVNAGQESAPYRFFTMTQDLFLLQHVVENTRMRLGNTPSLLDLIFTNEENLIDQMRYEAPIGKSDHMSLTFIYTTCIQEDRTDMIKLNYWKGNYGEINAELAKIDWSNLLNEKDLESGWMLVKNLLLKLTEKYIPIRHGKRKRKKNVWMTNATLKQIQTRDKAWKKYRRYQGDTNYNEYKKIRNKVVSMI